jgi:hypothetical protein
MSYLVKFHLQLARSLSTAVCHACDMSHLLMNVPSSDEIEVCSQLICSQSDILNLEKQLSINEQ